MTEPIIDDLATVWTSVADLATPFTEAEWKTPTALEGWTVQDNLSHLLGTERMLLGDPPPTADISGLAHVKTPFGEMMEVPVQARRHLPGAEVLDEFRHVVERRLDQLRAMAPEEFEKVGWSPVGEVPYRTFMQVRCFDSWMHEQDIRRAVERPGHLQGPVIDVVLDRFRAALPVIIGKRAAAPEGATVVISVTGPQTFDLAYLVEGRARAVDEVPEPPTVRVQLPFESFVALGGGRWDRERAIAAGGVTIEGDQALGTAVLDHFAFTP